MLDAQSIPLEHLTRLAPDVREQLLRNHLGGFWFSGNTVHHHVHLMSGGEKARLALALIVWQKLNLLLLDEPSNHLDIDTSEALALALSEFSGSMLLVQHDRLCYAPPQTVSGLWPIGALPSFHEAIASTTTDRKALRRQQTASRQQLQLVKKPLETKIKKLETLLSQQQKALDLLNEEMMAERFYGEMNRLRQAQATAEHGELTKIIAQLENQWLEIQEALKLLSFDEQITNISLNHLIT